MIFRERSFHRHTGSDTEDAEENNVQGLFLLFYVTVSRFSCPETKVQIWVYFGPFSRKIYSYVPLCKTCQICLTKDASTYVYVFFC